MTADPITDGIPYRNVSVQQRRIICQIQPRCVFFILLMQKPLQRTISCLVKRQIAHDRVVAYNLHSRVKVVLVCCAIRA